MDGECALMMGATVALFYQCVLTVSAVNMHSCIHCVTSGLDDIVFNVFKRVTSSTFSENYAGNFFGKDFNGCTDAALNLGMAVGWVVLTITSVAMQYKVTGKGISFPKSSHPNYTQRYAAGSRNRRSREGHSLNEYVDTAISLMKLHHCTTNSITETVILRVPWRRTAIIIAYRSLCQHQRATHAGYPPCSSVTHSSNCVSISLTAMHTTPAFALQSTTRHYQVLAGGAAATPPQLVRQQHAGVFPGIGAGRGDKRACQRAAGAALGS